MTYAGPINFARDPQLSSATAARCPATGITGSAQTSPLSVYWRTITSPQMPKGARRKRLARQNRSSWKGWDGLLGREGDGADEAARGPLQLMIEQFGARAADDVDGVPTITRLPGFPTDGGTVRLPGRDADEVRDPECLRVRAESMLTQPVCCKTLAVLLPLLILLSTLLFLLLLFILFLILVRRKSRITLGDEGGPLNLEDEDEIEGEGGLSGIEARWLEQVEPPTRIGYERAKRTHFCTPVRDIRLQESPNDAVWQQQYAPNSDPTDITLSQFLTIQEKGISAWSFEPDYESNSAVFVQGRTEISFLADGTGMSGDEGGGCCVQSNLPVPKVNEVYYFECKMYEKPESTNIAIGLATKPYPTFRLPGTHCSICDRGAAD